MDFIQQFISQLLGGIGDDLTLPSYEKRLSEARGIYDPYLNQQKTRTLQDFGTAESRINRNVGFTNTDLSAALADLGRSQGIERGAERENLAGLGFSGGLRNKLSSLAEQERQSILRRTRTPYERELLSYRDSLSDLSRDRTRYGEDFNRNREAALQGYIGNALNFVNL